MSSSSGSQSDYDSESDSEIENTSSSFTDSTTSLTPSLTCALFHKREGRLYSALNPTYWIPLGPSHTDLELTWARSKDRVFGDLYPPEAGERLERLLSKPGSRVLDVGCGSMALWLMAIAMRFSDAEARGDYYAPPNFSTEVFDVCSELPSPSAHFQVVHTSWLSLFLRSSFTFASFINEVGRCLAPGGIYYLIEPTWELATESGKSLASTFPALHVYTSNFRGHPHAQESQFFSHHSFIREVKASKLFFHVIERTIDEQIGSRGIDGEAVAQGQILLDLAFLWLREEFLSVRFDYSKEIGGELNRRALLELEGLRMCEKGKGLKMKTRWLKGVRY